MTLLLEPSVVRAGGKPPPDEFFSEMPAMAPEPETEEDEPDEPD